MSMMRPQSFVSPLLLGIGIYIHRKYGSQELIVLPSSLRFCCTYDKVMKFEASVMKYGVPTTELAGDGFQQCSFDNADHNICTPDERSAGNEPQN